MSNTKELKKIHDYNLKEMENELTYDEFTGTPKDVKTDIGRQFILKFRRYFELRSDSKAVPQYQPKEIGIGEFLKAEDHHNRIYSSAIKSLIREQRTKVLNFLDKDKDAVMQENKKILLQIAALEKKYSLVEGRAMKEKDGKSPSVKTKTDDPVQDWLDSRAAATEEAKKYPSFKAAASVQEKKEESDVKKSPAVSSIKSKIKATIKQEELKKKTHYTVNPVTLKSSAENKTPVSKPSPPSATTTSSPKTPHSKFHFDLQKRNPKAPAAKAESKLVVPPTARSSSISKPASIVKTHYVEM
jgi:hypothetical protein